MLDERLTKLLDEARGHMHKSLEHLAQELLHIRAGRANAAMVDDVRVEAYGSHMPLNQVASVSTPAPDLIVIQPWDRSTLGPIERAIQAANLGLNPTNDGTLIRIAIPPLTEERRKELAKTARTKGEDARVAVRNVRKDSKNHIQRMVQDAKLPEDMRFEAEDRLQKLTDEFVGKVDEMLQKKEHDIMAV
ncbi:MAG TPA: ribosome recycling factor [Rubricoccaceae bacterium]|nr:ribosome recycling factor [Rubricoccaceae bacterium]